MIKKEDEFAKRIEDVQDIAKDLGYDPALIKGFKNAKTESELDRMLIDARHQAMKDDI